LSTSKFNNQHQLTKKPNEFVCVQMRPTSVGLYPNQHQYLCVCRQVPIHLIVPLMW